MTTGCRAASSTQRHLLRITGHRTAVRADQLRRVRGDRHLPRRGPDAGTHHPPRHLRRTDPDRRVLRGDQLGADLRLGRRRGGSRATDSGATFLADTAQRYIGVVGADIITVLYFTSLFACILAFHNVASRYIFALSQRDVLPESLSRPHDKHGSPHQASLWISGVVAISVVAAVVFKLDPAAQFYTWFAGATTVGFVVLLIATRWRCSLLRQGPARLFAVAGPHRARPRAGRAARSLVLIVVNLKDLVGGSTILAGSSSDCSLSRSRGCRHRDEGGDNTSHVMTYTVNSTYQPRRSRCRAGAAHALDDGSLTEIEMAWSDPFGHAQGKRIPASQFLDRRSAADSPSAKHLWAGTPQAR